MELVEDHHYYIDEYKTLEAFIKIVVDKVKNKKIKYIYNLCGISSSSLSFSDKVYSTSDYNYIVFDDDTVIKFQYVFFSMIDIYYTNLKCLRDKELLNLKDEREALLCKLDLDYVNNSIVDYEIETFNDEYIIDPRDDATRPDGGDYFKEIVFHLNNDKKLCICAQNAEFDGYCDIWIENNSLKEIFNGQSHKVWWK